MKISIRKIAWLALVICMSAVEPAISQTHKAKTSPAKSAGIMSTMVVRVIAPVSNGSDYIKVGFTTTDRMFKLPAKANAVYVTRLKQSMDKHTPVYVYRSDETSDIILKVITPGVPAQKRKK